MRRPGAAAMLAVVLAATVATPALGSGDTGPITIFINRHGGSLAERERLYAGRMGVLYANAPDGLLYLDWRLLNGLSVGSDVGKTLTTSCCEQPAYTSAGDGVAAWAEATKLISVGPAASPWMATELPGPDYTSVPNCFRDAFDTAAATLRRRVARYGADDRAVHAWLATQTAVFDACSKPDAALPPPMPNPPAWLTADRAYQEAAFALYKGQLADAFRRFRAILHDPSSPWQSRGFYLSTRVLQRAALTRPSPRLFAAARARIAKLEANPYAYGHAEARGMLRALAFRDRPDALLDQLDGELNAPAPVPDLAKGLRDYLVLSARRTPKPEIADWIATLRSGDRTAALAHATERWQATKKVAWLTAALSLARAGDPQAATLAADAGRVEAGTVAWPTAQYHQLRLTVGSADPAALRRQADAVLARDLSTSDRNLFRAVRAQVASSLPDMMAFAPRQAICAEADVCEGEGWLRADGTLAPGGMPGSFVALGPDVKAILDRLPLRLRMQAGAGLAQPFRRDLALTNYARAVQLQDDAAIDTLAGELIALVPELRSDWQAIRAQRPGPAKRFAEFLVLARMPGLSPDFAGYTRPQGSVREWQGDWWDWLIVPPGQRGGTVEPPAASRYNLWAPWGMVGDDAAAEGDLSCYGQCGSGDFPLTLPAFAVAQQGQAGIERARLRFIDAEKPLTPRGATSAWAALHDYARTHPRDPRSPEALYWLIRISRFGHIHDRLGYKSFRLLHARYPASDWTKRSPYYFD